MGPEYRYTQIGILTILMILLAAVFTALMFASGLDSTEGGDTSVLKVTALVVASLFVLTLTSFYSLIIQIADGKLNFWFGFGVGLKSFPITEILSVETVKNPWYYLWGIKSIPGGWLYSIAPGGLVIELIFKDNRKIHLGTNRPAEIKHRLNEAISRRF